jgi:lipopolysaccharide export system protein LptA
VSASSGLSLQTEQATYSRDEDVVRAPGAVTFQNGRMTGGGTGMWYDKQNDVLRVLADASVTMPAGENGTGGAAFSAGTAVLDRVQNFLELTGAAHVVREAQTLDGDAATVRLTDDDQVITAIELRGHSRVAGGETLESMTAQDMNLAYAEDGATLQRVGLSGGSAVAMKGANGATGRRLAGDTLDLRLDASGDLVGAEGTGGVRLELPAATGQAGRTVRARTFTSTGAEGAGLTEARFTDDVEYGEAPVGETKARTVRARTLTLALSGDAVKEASFGGGTRFEEADGLKAGAADMQYAPGAGTLRLRGADQRGAPRVEDEQITVSGQSIDVGIGDRKMQASGTVRTTLAGERPAARGADPQKLPGLFEKGRPVNVNASRLEYDGEAGSAVYTGEATLWQGDTTVRADGITLDRQSGDLAATGSARSTVPLDGSLSVGQADEIRYDDSARVLTLESGRGEAGARGAARGGTSATSPASPTPAGNARGRGGRAATPGASPLAHLTSPQGDLRAQRIEVVLAKTEGKVDRLEGYRRIDLTLEPKHATGDRLSYRAAEESYVLTGTPTSPVRVDDGCRATTGKTLTFFRSTDRILVDGNEQIRTQTKSGPSCDSPPARERAGPAR